MEKQFDLRKFLVENKLTNNSKLTEEQATPTNLRSEFEKAAKEVGFTDLVDRYADSTIESLPDLDDYLDEWEDQGFDPEFLDLAKLKQDIITFAKNL